MNRIMYSGLACAIIFILVCIGIRYSNLFVTRKPAVSAEIESEMPDAPPEAVLELISKQAKQQPQPAKADTPEPQPIQPMKGPVLALSGIKNFLKNPSANDGTQHWTTVKDVSVSMTENNNPSFTLRNNGRLKQKIKLLNTSMQYIVVGTCGYTSHINSDNNDPAGLPLVKIYFEDRFNKSHTEDSTEVIMAQVNKNGWGQIGVVKQIPEDTLYLHLELFQAKGNSSLQGRTTRFDDICVSVARTKDAGSKMLDSYIKQAQAFKR